MKRIALLAVVFMFGCADGGDPAIDRQNVETTIRNLQLSLKEAYTTKDVDIDALFRQYYDSAAYYVTPWGTSELLDSTRSRLKITMAMMQSYDYSIESMDVKVYGDGAFAFFILRQWFTINGTERNEYLPTTMALERRGETWKIVHIHRSADPESWQQWFGVIQN